MWQEYAIEASAETVLVVMTVVTDAVAMRHKNILCPISIFQSHTKNANESNFLFYLKNHFWVHTDGMTGNNFKAYMCISTC